VAGFQVAAEDEPRVPPVRRNPDVDFSGTKRSNDTHASTTDPAAPFKVSRNTTSVPSYLARVDGESQRTHRRRMHDESDGNGRTRSGALKLVKRRSCKKSITLGADKGYDSAALGTELRSHNVSPHIAQSSSRRSAVDG